MRRFILGLLTLLAIASLADAGGLLLCRRCRRCHAANVACAVAVAEEVVAPVAQFVPIQVPTYSVTYTPIVQQITRQESYTTVPVATRVDTTTTSQTYGPPATTLFQANGQQVQGYSQVQQGYVQQGVQQNYQQPLVTQAYAATQSTDNADRIEAALLDFLKLRRQLAQTEKALADCLTHQQPTPLPGPMPGPPIPNPAPGPAPSPAPMNLAPLTPAQVQAIFGKVYRGEMPKGGPQLTDQEMGIVSQWVGNGAKPTPEVVKLFTAKCAACHAASVSATKGGPNKFTLLQ